MWLVGRVWPLLKKNRDRMRLLVVGRAWPMLNLDRVVKLQVFGRAWPVLNLELGRAWPWPLLNLHRVLDTFEGGAWSWMSPPGWDLDEELALLGSRCSTSLETVAPGEGLGWWKLGWPPRCRSNP